MLDLWYPPKPPKPKQVSVRHYLMRDQIKRIEPKLKLSPEERAKRRLELKAEQSRRYRIRQQGRCA